MVSLSLLLGQETSIEFDVVFRHPLDCGLFKITTPIFDTKLLVGPLCAGVFSFF